MAEATKTTKDVVWYTPEVSESDLVPEVREILEKYSNVPSDQVPKHVWEVRERAWAVFPYPCLGQWRFLHLSIHKNPAYSEVLERTKKGDKFLDLGCALGQELRKLAYDGAPSENLYGADLRIDFINIGYSLFKDQDKFKAHFIAADVFDLNSALNQLNGQISNVFIGSFLHLFNWDQQFAICKRIVSLLDLSKENLVLGRQVGNVEASEYQKHILADDQNKTRFRHNTESFAELWNKVGEATGTKWETKASQLSLTEVESYAAVGWNPAGSTRLTFTVRRKV